jgi:hypothetical protein
MSRATIKETTTMMRYVTLLAVAIAVGTLFSTATAIAAPVLEPEITRVPTVVPRNDEQVTYLVDVKNVASPNPAPGDTLTCNPNYPGSPGTVWFNADPAKFEYQWRSDGVEVSSFSVSADYVVTPADAGTALQCVVKATNSSESASIVTFTPPIVASPVAETPPPTPASELANLRPEVTGTAAEGEVLTCAAPTTWTGVTATDWTYQWLRNGAAIPGATASAYTVTTDDVTESPPAPAPVRSVLQCQATAINASGGIVAFSENLATVPGPDPAAPNNNNASSSDGPTRLPFVEFANGTSGLVTVELELPVGEETRAYRIFDPNEPNVPPVGWDCSAAEAEAGVPAKVTCTRTSAVNAGASYPSIGIAASVGADAADPAIARVTVSGGGSPTAMIEDVLSWAAPTLFGIEAFSTKVADAAGDDYTQAGGHPYSANATLALNTKINRVGERAQIEFLKNVRTDTPPGFIGNPEAAPQVCETLDAVFADTFDEPTCPRVSIVGSVTVDTSATLKLPGLPLYMVKPEVGSPAQLEFAIRGVQVMYALTPRLRPEDGYAISVDAAPVSKNPVLFSASVTLCGFGANVVKSDLTQALGAPKVVSCKEKGEPGANPHPFLTNPTSCSETPPVTKVSVDSWDNPGVFTSAEAISPKVTGCEIVPFNPTASLQPDSHAAESPTGLDVSISMPTEGLESPSGIAQGNLKRAVVTLPPGMSVNPSSAHGLAVCTQAQLGMVNGVPNAAAVACPPQSKIGTATIKTPILAEALEGSVYLAKQGENPFGSLLAIYLVVESKERGILIKIAGRVDADPVTGQLVSTFDDNPQAPIESVDLHFDSGSRAALLAPSKCGTYGIKTELSPWSAKDPDAPTAAEIRTSTSTYAVTSGPGGSPCPDGALAPRMKAGLANPVAGSTSPFTMSLTREDGSQRFSSLDLTMPPGLTAYLRGIPYCSDAALAGVSTALGTGAAEIAASSCPAASQVGTVSVGAGAGPNPYYVDTGRAYLAGPYKGAPISIAIITPAVAGPFDLGSVVVRAAAHVDPETARITVKSDPIPTILHGIPLDVREIRVNVDRPGFTLAPTNCEEMAVSAQVGGVEGTSVPVSNRFQVGECAALGFKPALSLRLKGGTKRSQHPALTAVLTQPLGQANIKKVSVTLPRAQFIDQSRIGDVCTRPQFAAGACPTKSVLGRATAYSPLLDDPLTGTVYLRANGGERELPDMVADLNGQVHVVLVGYVDAVVKPGTEISRIRNTFALVPDAPVSRFVLKLNPGKRALLENSANLCKSPQKAVLKMDAQNGKFFDSQPLIKNDCKKKKSNRQKKRR